MRLASGIAIISLCFSAVASAQTDAQRRAQEELDRELSQMVGSTPARVRVSFQGLDEPNYDVTQAEFELDGKALVAPSTQALSGSALVPVYLGDVSPGRHVVKARLTILNKRSAVVTDEGGFTWRVAGSVDFDIQRGIEVAVVMVVSASSLPLGAVKTTNARFPQHVSAKQLR